MSGTGEMTGEKTGQTPELHHQHRDVNGGWLRPAVFGAMDGLVSNFALIAGIAGGRQDPKIVLLAGLAGLAAGAFSMAAGEYISVASQSELALAEIEIERLELARNPVAEQRELAGVFEARGVDAETAAEVGFDIGTISDPEEYDLVYKLNIPDPGYYSGIELSYSQTLGFLPPPLNTIGVQLNYTWIDIGSIESAMSFDKNNVYQDAAIREQVSHALDMGAVKNQFNMVLNWKFKKLTLLATVHSEGRVLKWSTINPVRYFRDAATYYMNEYHYMQPRTVVDLRVEYNLLRNFGAYVQFRDLFDAPIRYTANDRFLNYARKGNPMIEIGFKGWF